MILTANCPEGLGLDGDIVPGFVLQVSSRQAVSGWYQFIPTVSYEPFLKASFWEMIFLILRKRLSFEIYLGVKTSENITLSSEANIFVIFISKLIRTPFHISRSFVAFSKSTVACKLLGIGHKVARYFYT